MLFLWGASLGMTVLPVLSRVGQFGLDPKATSTAAGIGSTVLIPPIVLVHATVSTVMTRWTDTYVDSLSLPLEHGKAVVEDASSGCTIFGVQDRAGGELNQRVKCARGLADGEREVLALIRPCFGSCAPLVPLPRLFDRPRST
ncbi:MAG: hypothetical protein U1D30_16040 [Planctomycetota bacterium]